MMKINKRWLLKDAISDEADASLSRFPAPFRQILFHRGIATYSEAERFLAARAPEQANPFKLTDMQKAVDRLQIAIKNGESIAIYGDYDADGVTATALMMQAFTALGAQVQAYIPNRFDEGYGLNNDALEELYDRGVRVVVTVDCGIRALGEAEFAGKLGLDLIITDHHSPGPELPGAFAVINPKRPNDEYPEKNLAGVGVAYKVASALVKTMAPQGFDIEALLDLVAIGTVADLVPLTEENRYLVRAGLQRMRFTQRQGLFSLLNANNVNPSQVNASHIGFSIGPRLNAAGRLASAMSAYELLTTSDLNRAVKLVQELENHNKERQKITREMQEIAEKAFDPGQLPYLLFAADESFNAGVVGLTASRLTEMYYRPSVVGHREEDTTRASCRSIPEFDITAALNQCDDLLIRYGGHAAAAGFTVANDRLDEFLERLSGIAREQLADSDLRPVIWADVEVALKDLDDQLLNLLDRLQPTGYANPEPVFMSRGLRVSESRTVGRDSSHLKLTLQNGAKKMDSIAFRQGHWQEMMPEYVDVMFNFEKNEFRGRVTPQLNIRDIRPSES